MVVLTIVTNSNPCTVYFDNPLPKADFVRILSCSLYNSWYNLKQQGKISLTHANGAQTCPISLTRGHYTLQNLADIIETAFAQTKVTLPTKIYTPVGAMVIETPVDKTIGLDSNLAGLLGIGSTLRFKTFVKRLQAPSTYYIHCDLVDKEKNLFNGKPSSILARFDKRGKGCEKISYQPGPSYEFRDASSGEFMNSLTISVKDEDGNHFDFNGFSLSYEVEIN